MIEYRRVERDQLERIRDIDRSEHIHGMHRFERGRLLCESVNLDAPNWSDDHTDFSHGGIIRHARAYFDLGGSAIGAFVALPHGKRHTQPHADRLVGLGLYRPRLSETMGQLAQLYVSNGYRRRGIASELLRRIFAWASADGARALYVSATPSDSELTTDACGSPAD